LNLWPGLWNQDHPIKKLSEVQFLTNPILNEETKKINFKKVPKVKYNK